MSRQQGIDLITMTSHEDVGPYLSTNRNIFSGMSIVFRVVVTAMDGNYKESLEAIRKYSHDIPVLLYVGNPQPFN